MFEQDLKCGSNQFNILNWCIFKIFSPGSLSKVNGNSPKAVASEIVFCVFILEGFVAFRFCYLGFSPNLKVSIVNNFIPVPEIIN